MLSRAPLTYPATRLSAGGLQRRLPNLSSCAASNDPDRASATGGNGEGRKTATSTMPGFKMFENGKKDGPTILFVHGWPDDHMMWDKQVAHLKGRYRCITTDLPGFGDGGNEHNHADVEAEKNGYSIDEIVARLERTVEEAGEGSPVTIVAHDWGCTFSFLVEKRRPELVEKMVAIDVGGAVEPGFFGLLTIVSYHMWLIAAFRVGGAVGDAMARSFAWLVGAPSGARVAKARSCYPYYQWWKRKFDKSQAPIKNLMPEAPLLFLYGTAGYKRFLPFHADWWAKKVDEKEGSSAVAMTKSRHWVTADQPDEVNRRLDAFLGQK